MSTLRTVVLGCALLLVGGPAFAQEQDIERLIAGKWETSQKLGDTDIRVQIEFGQTNKATITVRDIALVGRYQLLRDKRGTLKLSLKDDNAKAEEYEVKVTAESLELKDSRGKTDKFKRVR